MSRPSTLPPSIEFRLDCPVYTQEEPDLAPHIAIRHPHGRARINLAALELRPSGRRFQLHVLNLSWQTVGRVRKLLPGTSRGVYLTLTAEEAERARELGVPLRDKPKPPPAWKRGTVTIQTENGPEEALASIRRAYAIHKVTVARPGSWPDRQTGEVHDTTWTDEAYRLTHILSGKSVWTAKRRNAVEALADELEESIPELATLTDPFPPEIRERFEALVATWTEMTRAYTKDEIAEIRRLRTLVEGTGCSVREERGCGAWVVVPRAANRNYSTYHNNDLLTVLRDAVAAEGWA